MGQHEGRPVGTGALVIVKCEQGAEEWLRAWGRRAFALNRAQRLAAEQRGLAASCGERLPERRNGHLRAAEHIERAIRRNA